MSAIKRDIDDYSKKNSACTQLVFLVSISQQVMAGKGTVACKANPAWITKPSMPAGVKKSGKDGSSTFCDFYQFSRQAMLNLMSPSANKKNAPRNFEVNTNYPVPEFDDNGKPLNSCDEKVTGTTHRTDLGKVKSNLFGTGQAGDDASIYDQNGNVVYCEVRFNKGMCSVGALRVSNPTQGYEISNQRGSLRPANAVAETTCQHVNLNPAGFSSNCFGCHNYLGTGESSNNNVKSNELSHIFDDIEAGLGTK